MAKILVVEDEYDIRELLQNYLENEGYQVVTAFDGEQAIEIFHSSNVDLILLDILLPRLNGYEVCTDIREESDIPIIMLTALDSEEDQLKGFDLRIDDYIPKPFSMPVLLRKIGAVLRRTMGDSISNRINYKALTLDLDGYKVYISGQIVDLTQREFELLKVLLQNQGRVLSRQTLLNRVWSYDFYGDERIVDTHIKNLRKKLGLDYIETIRGGGIELIAKLKTSLTAKIFFVTCLLLTAVCVLTYGLTAQLMPLTYTADQERLLAVQADRLAKQLEEYTLADCEPLLSQFTFQYGVPVSIQDSAEHNVGGIDPSDIMLAEENGRLKMVPANPSEENLQLNNESSNYIVSCIGLEFSFEDSSEKYQLLVFTSTRAVNQAVEALGRIWPWLAVAILLVSVLTSLFYAHFITRPIVRLSGISQKLSELDFSWQCGEQRTDEIGTLARNLDELANRLSHSMQELQAANDTLRKDIEREQQLEQAQRDFFSAVSHELKTPITVMKGQLGGMLDGIGVYADREKYLARSLAVANQMESLVQELLTVSRMEGGGELSMIPVELTALIQSCLQNYDELFQQKEQEVVADLPPEIWSTGDPALLKKALGNLLSNAALYSSEGAKIFLSVHLEDKSILLTVENESAHIALELLPHLFEPFFRSEPSRSRQTGGSGLGLYLVQKIAEQHGGCCQIRNAERGVCATLILPNSTQTTH